MGRVGTTTHPTFGDFSGPVPHVRAVSPEARSAEVPVDSAVPDASFVLPENATRATPAAAVSLTWVYLTGGTRGGTGAELPDPLSHRRMDD